MIMLMADGGLGFFKACLSILPQDDNPDEGSEEEDSPPFKVPKRSIIQKVEALVGKAS